MCGIFGYAGSRSDAPEMILKGLKQLEYRGYDSWGVASIPDDANAPIIVEKHIGKIGDAVLQKQSTAHIALGHTRWATHGGVTELNAHPHLDATGTIAVVHNGIIENYLELKNELMSKGYHFISETDTEVLPHAIAEELKTKPLKEAVQSVFARLTGLNAFIVMDRTTRQFCAVRLGSPLAIGVGADGYYISSDATAMSEYTDQVYYMEDDDLVMFDQNGVQLFDVRTGTGKKLQTQKLEFTASDISKGTFPDYMSKEIAEQPRVLQNVIDQMDQALQSYVHNLHGELNFVGCGTAYYASLMATYFFAVIAGKKSHAYAGSEFEHFRNMNPDAFTTFLSQSGETIDIVQQAQALQKEGKAFGAITNRLGSTLERMTPNKVLLPAGPELCVLATKSFTAKLAVTFLLAHLLNGSSEEGKTLLRTALAGLKNVLEDEYVQLIKPLAETLAKQKKIFVIGRGVSYPLALEAALKMKEVTYVHAEGLAGGELKHGVIALIEPGTPCIVFAPNDSTYDAIISNAIELKSRGAQIIGISHKSNAAFDTYFPVTDAGFATTIPAIAVVQLLAYHMAMLLGNDPDKPRNLAKSVTVK